MAWKEEKVDLAKLAEQAERYDDMVEEMKYVVENTEEDLTDEERNLLSVAYKNVVGARRSAWRIINSLEEKAKDENKKRLAQNYRLDVENELEKKCEEVLDLIKTKLLELAEKAESEVFYLKMQGDYFRYLVEIKSDDKDKVENSKEAYEKATEKADKLAETHPIRLGLALNFSVFYYEIERDPDKACQLAEGAFNKAMAKMIDHEQNENTEESSYKDSTLILQLLRDNLTLWKQEADEQDEQGGD